MHKTKVITSIFNSFHPKPVQSPLNIFWISGPFKQIFLIWNHKWRDYSLQKVRVTDTRHCTESERININLQVVNYWLLEMKSLNYEEVFFVELKWILWNSTDLYSERRTHKKKKNQNIGIHSGLATHPIS